MTKEEKAEFHSWIRKELQYWKRLFRIKTRICLRREPKFVNTSTMMMTIFDVRQSTILYNPDIISSKRVTVTNYLVHELIHVVHQVSDAPLFEYAEKNESFKSVYAESSKFIEKMCDVLAAAMVELDGKHERN
jgi:predicted metal-dependent peptidase